MKMEKQKSVKRKVLNMIKSGEREETRKNWIYKTINRKELKMIKENITMQRN